MNSRLRPASDEEFDKGNFVKVPGKYREKSQCWFIISALVQGINDNEHWDLCLLEYANNKCLHLKTKGFPSNVRVCRQHPEQLLSEAWVPVSELEGKGGGNCLEITPVLVVLRTEETHAEHSVCKADLCECLGNC